MGAGIISQPLRPVGYFRVCVPSSPPPATPPGLQDPACHRYHQGSPDCARSSFLASDATSGGSAGHRCAPSSVSFAGSLKGQRVRDLAPHVPSLPPTSSGPRRCSRLLWNLSSSYSIVYKIWTMPAASFRFLVAGALDAPRIERQGLA